MVHTVRLRLSTFSSIKPPYALMPAVIVCKIASINQSQNIWTRNYGRCLPCDLLSHECQSVVVVAAEKQPAVIARYISDHIWLELHKDDLSGLVFCKFSLPHCLSQEIRQEIIAKGAKTKKALSSWYVYTKQTIGCLNRQEFLDWRPWHDFKNRVIYKIHIGYCYVTSLRVYYVLQPLVFFNLFNTSEEHCVDYMKL